MLQCNARIVGPRLHNISINYNISINLIRGLHNSGSCSQLADQQDDMSSRDDVEGFRRRKADYKRRQNGQTFLDHLIVSVHAGKGGDGAVAFHREKFKPNGPPSGGNGGQGGNVYVKCVPNINSLIGITKKVRGANGGNGLGTWCHGKNALDEFICVPPGTVVREVMDHRRSKDQYEAEEESLEGLEGEERLKKIRSLRWVHYPQFDSWDGDFFQEAEEELMKEERAEARAREWQKAQREAGDPAYQGLEFEFTKPTPSNDKGILVASGGAGGYGNPHFLTLKNRSPKFATRGKPGGRITLEFELKLLADIGLVGFPNAGKSTILRALTRSRAEVAPYAFTTLNPQVGTVRVWEDGRYEAVDHRLEAQSTPIEDSVLEREKQEEIIRSGGYPSSSKKSDHGRLQGEALRFTIADNPGLIARASENVGLGHAFLKSIERSLALVYVVDLSGDAPWDELRILKNELEKYKPGLSSNARMVLANKADLLDDSDPEKVAIAKQKLKRLEDAVRDIEKDYPLDLTSPADQDLALTSVSEPLSRPPIDVVPISAKYKLNLELAVEHMARYVTEARGLQPE